MGSPASCPANHERDESAMASGTQHDAQAAAEAACCVKTSTCVEWKDENPQLCTGTLMDNDAVIATARYASTDAATVGHCCKAKQTCTL